MTLAEMMVAAKADGYQQFNDGARTWDLDAFAEAIADDRGEWTYDFNGRITEHGLDGYKKQTHWRLLREREE